MRDIKFRAWSTVSGSYDYFTMQEALLMNVERIGSKGINEDLTYYQFTGLQDKNGVDIYEGDIVKKDSKICEVVFSKKAAKFCVRMPSHQWHGVVQKVYSIIGVEVIGNIHENPELLK
jgi:uncharacterized phage protein (TIGR01671 family)